MIRAAVSGMSLRNVAKVIRFNGADARGTCAPESGGGGGSNNRLGMARLTSTRHGT